MYTSQRLCDVTGYARRYSWTSYKFVTHFWIDFWSSQNTLDYEICGDFWIRQSSCIRYLDLVKFRIRKSYYPTLVLKGWIVLSQIPKWEDLQKLCYLLNLVTRGSNAFLITLRKNRIILLKPNEIFVHHTNFLLWS